MIAPAVHREDRLILNFKARLCWRDRALSVARKLHGYSPDHNHRNRLDGGSFGLALRNVASGDALWAVTASRSSNARKDSASSMRGEGNPLKAVHGSQIVLLATPVGAIIELIERLGSTLSPQTLLTDVW